MPFRVSFFCQVQQERLGGWSENYWNSLSDLTAVIPLAKALRIALYTCKGRPVGMPTIRISPISNVRQVKILTFPVASANSTDPSLLTDYATQKAGLKLMANPSFTVRQWFGGVYDEDIASGGRWDPTPDDLKAFKALFAILTNAANGWALRKIDTSVMKKTVQAISVAGVVSSLGHGLETDDLVRVGRVLTPNNINKVWKVVKISADSYSLNGFQTLTSAPIVKNSTYGQKQQFNYYQIASAEIERATSHRVGRPFGQLSGRRRRQRTFSG